MNWENVFNRTIKTETIIDDEGIKNLMLKALDSLEYDVENEETQENLKDFAYANCDVFDLLGKRDVITVRAAHRLVWAIAENRKDFLKEHDLVGTKEEQEYWRTISKKIIAEGLKV